MSNHARLIQDNIHLLCDNTIITQEFLEQCMDKGKGVLTKDEAEGISLEKTGYERSGEFFRLIVSKDPSVIETLLTLMTEQKSRENFGEALKLLGSLSSGEAEGTKQTARKQKKSVQFNSAAPENIPRWPSVADEEELEDVNL